MARPSPVAQEDATMSDPITNDPPPADGAATGVQAGSDVLVGTSATAPGANPSAEGIGASAAGAATGRAKDVAMYGAPWRRGVGWREIGAEGLVVAVVGVYIVADPDGAQDVLRQLLGALLLVNGILRVLQGFRENAQGLPATPYRLVTGGIGATVGVIVLAEWFSDYIDADAARWVLGFGLLAFGLIGLAAAVATRETGGLRTGPLITGVLYTVFAVLIFYNLRHDSLDVRWFGYGLLILGALMLVFAYLLYSREKAGNSGTAAV
jgi:uncharacterized membrane protein HdeD (DUF308 family)